MFEQLKNMAGGLLNNANPQDVSEAAAEHVQKMDSQELGDNLEGAAEKLQEEGQGDLAQQVMGVVSQVQSNPSGAKDAAINLIKNNPQLLQRFAPDFLQGILSKIKP